MKISEIFYSIQGEIDVGKPSVFVRTSSCNMEPKCNFCDSDFSWNKRGKEMTTDEIYNEIKKYHCTNIVFTGGEPMLQLEEIVKVMSMLIDKRDVDKIYTFDIETNGLLDDKLLYKFNNVNCSPKKQNYNIESLKGIDYKNSRFKFVYENKNNRWWEKVIKEANIDIRDVYIMSEGKTKEEQEVRMEEVIEYCKEKGYNFTPRFHTLMWGDKRGK